MKLRKEDLLLYAVTDRSWLNGQTLYAQVEKALQGGVTMVQLREKNLSIGRFKAVEKELSRETRQDAAQETGREIRQDAAQETAGEEGRKRFQEMLLNEAYEIRELCRRWHVPFIVNDNADLAKLIDADGVHVGQSDLDPCSARALLGSDKIIGVSARTREQALLAQEQGADYIGVGAAFSTGTKQDARVISYEQLKDVCAAVSIPAVAIGGITMENLPKLAGSGISGIAAVSAVFAQNDIVQGVSDLKKAVMMVLQ